MLRTIFTLSVFLFSSSLTLAEQITSKKIPEHLSRPAVTIEWTDLLPEEDLRLLESIPQVDHDSLSADELAMDTAPNGFKSNSFEDGENSAFESQITKAISDANKQVSENKQRDWRDALTSTRVRPEYNNKKVRIAGYIVPIEYNDNQVITEFFLVPYFGACIHVPPPPPNQLIYIKHPKGFQLQELYTPFWVEGTILLETWENDLGLSSYSMRNVKLTEYKEEAEPEYLN